MRGSFPLGIREKLLRSPEWKRWKSFRSRRKGRLCRRLDGSRGETASPIGEIIDGRPFRRYPLSRIFSLDLDDIKIGARYPRIVRINFLDVDDAQRLYSVSATGARKFEHACHTQRYEIGREAECVGQLADGDERNDRTAEIIRRNQFLPRTVRKPIRSR